MGKTSLKVARNSTNKPCNLPLISAYLASNGKALALMSKDKGKELSQLVANLVPLGEPYRSSLTRCSSEKQKDGKQHVFCGPIVGYSA